MNKKIIVVFVFVLIAGGALLFLPFNQAPKTIQAYTVTLHKSPTCGCCSVYGSYLKKLGYKVEVHDTDNLAAEKTRLGVPLEVQSCHTSEVAGYVVEGHIPEEVIQKLLTEKPDIKGIGMAGMPAGSPGMPGPKTEDFVIYKINQDGTVGDAFITL